MEVRMSTPAAIDLGAVQKMLLLPLWGRAEESRKPRPLLRDSTAVRVIQSMDYDFTTIARNISEVTRVAWIACSLHADRTIRAFLERHPDATVVNLGCGLDTTFERVDNGSVAWYDLDLPDTIELRRHYIPEGARNKFLACSIFSNEWLAHVRGAASLFFLSMGVLYYFDEGLIRAFLITLANEFPESEALFDVCSPAGMRIANEKVIKASGMGQDVMLHWGIKHTRDMEKWDPRIAVVEEYPVFRRLKCSFGFRSVLGLTLSDALRIMSIVHLRLKQA
jgi:O-methyltransferase involved in polyketide biosynthesis